ncbi:MAG: FtsH protease activity modulator HflK, partial [Alphaproteobacteria bacterium]|nr:FtsH protease activity modulator HflK [Alphaproteobacteria bacterium]
SGFYQVGTTQLGVVLRLGEPQRVEQPGLRYRLPAPFETVLLPEVTLNRTIEIGFRSQSRRGGPEQDIGDESLMLTGDESVVQLNFEVLWQVDPASVQDFLFNVRDPELTVKAAAESVMRGIIGQTTIQAILTGSTDISQQAKEKLQETLSDYESGILITQINLRERKPPDDVREAFDDVNRASSDKDTTINEARTFARKITLEAEGTAARLKAEAEGYKQQVINRAKGQADRFTSVYQSYSASPTTSARNMYLEAMEDILGSANKIIIDDKAGLTSFLPLQDYLKRSGPGANTPAPRGDNER